MSISLPLLKTKLYLPSARPHCVPRVRLLERLSEGLMKPLTLIAAPAGFGKTTLISAWCATANREFSCAWVSLDEEDNDPTRFLTYLIAALQAHQANVGVIALELLAAPQVPPPKAILTLLLNDLGAFPTPLALILDDYHLITAPVIHEALTFFIDHLPPQMHLIITTRIDPPLPLARWRVRNQLAEVRADDLRFTPAEAATFLNDVMGLTLSSAEITALETRTEGWIAGLQLAALSVQGRADVTRFIQAFSGSNRHVLSYLVEEVLNRRPPDTLTFLLQTSILDQMCASLCDAVTGEIDGRTSLAKLEQANLFLIPLDDEGKWYRYHHLFAEVLRTRLQQSQPTLIPQLHRRASEWYEAVGQLEQAVGHALAMPDIERTATLLERVALATLLQQSQVLLVRQLVERLPVATIYARPHLTLIYGIALTMTGQFESMELLLRQAALTLNRPELPDDVTGGLLLLHSLAARFRGDSVRALELGQQALQQLPGDALALRAGTAMNIGAAYLRQGERSAAGQALADAVTWGSAAGADYIVLAALEELATDQARQGHLVQTKQICEQALARVMRGGSQRVPAAGMAHIIIGEVLVEWNELAQADRALTQGIQLLHGTAERGLLARGYSALARCQWAGGGRETALATLHQGAAWLTQIQIGNLGAHDWLAAQRALLQLWQGELVAALHWEQAIQPAGESPLSYFQQLTSVRIRLAQHAREPRASFLQEATTILTPLLASAEVNGWGSHVIEIRLLQALVEQAQGKRAAAQATLTRALTLAEPAGYIRVFVDEGEAMRLLIAECGMQNAEFSTPLHNYIGKLLAAFAKDKEETKARQVAPPFRGAHWAPHSGVPSGPRTLVDPLSARELEVLQLVAAGLSNTQIAARLIVATGTVKTHINHIFGKLEVESRIQAVVRARELGLLND